jgi:phosphoribosyl-AMP cyclohydrolase
MHNDSLPSLYWSRRSRRIWTYGDAKGRVYASFRLGPDDLRSAST